MNVCQVPNGGRYYPPFGADSGAWEAHRLALGLTNIGIKSDVLTMPCAGGKFSYKRREIGPDATANSYANRTLFALSIWRNLPSLIRSESYDIIHYHCVLPALLSVNKVKRPAASIVTWADPFIGGMIPPQKTADVVTLARGLKKVERLASVFLQKSLLENVTRIISVSAVQRERLHSFFGIDAARIDVIPPGVETEVFRPNLDTAPLRKHLGIEDNEFVIMCPARIARLKSQIDLMKALVVLDKSGIPFRALFVGDETEQTYRAELQIIAHQNSLENRITFTGFVAAGDFPFFYNVADVVVLPSVAEALPSSLLEGMSSGRPVISSDIPSSREVAVRGNELLFYPPGDSSKLGELLLDLWGDSELRLKMSRLGRETVLANFTWKRVAQMTKNVYTRALSKPAELRGPLQ